MKVRDRPTVRVNVSVRSEMCKLCMRDFETAQRNLQTAQFANYIAQIDKSRTTQIFMSCDMNTMR